LDQPTACPTREAIPTPAWISTNGLFEAGQWDALAVAKPPTPTSARAIGLDVNPARTRSCVAAAADLGEGRVMVEILREDKGVDWVVAELVGLHREYPDSSVVVDQASQARTLIPDLKAAGVQVVTTDVKGMTDASAGFYDATIEGRLVHLNQPVLNAAVEAATQRQVGDAWAWARRAPKGDISALVSASLAMWGLRNPLAGRGGILMFDEELGRYRRIL
jgi:hypothetical protein